MHDMRVYFPNAAEFADDLRTLFRELDQVRRTGCPALGQCAPDLDLFEKPDRYEICVDLPGATPDAIRVVIKGEVIIIAGEKLPRDPLPPRNATFHVAERHFGRFARAVRLTAAFDGARVEARYRLGELQIVVPRIEERRGRDTIVAIQTDDGKV